MSLWEALGGFGWLWEALGAIGKLWEAVGCSEKHWEALGGSGRLREDRGMTILGLKMLRPRFH